MKVVEIKTTEGPNYWSVYRHRLIVLLLDIEDMEEKPTDMIPGFYERMTQLMPSLQDHQCSVGVKGGFLKRVRQGTWMGHVVEHIALEIQILAGLHVAFGRTRPAGINGLYYVVFAYEDVEAGKYAAKAAVRITEALIHGTAYNIQHDIEALKTIAAGNRPGPSTNAIIQEAVKRNIPVIRLNDDCLIQLGYGSAQRRIEATIASTTSSIAVDVACDKNATRQLLQKNYVPVPEGSTLIQEEQLQQIINDIGFPVVIKPVDGNHGKGITTNITTYEDAITAFRLAKEFSSTILCEKFIEGNDYRILVINYQFVAAALRSPASVTGDGIHSIRELVAIVNQDPKRGNNHEQILTKINIDEATRNLIGKQGVTPDSILPNGYRLVLKSTANLSTGGTAEDVTDEVHAANKALFERVARIIGLDICGIDVIASTLQQPIIQHGPAAGGVLEVNAAPGFRMHLAPACGKPRNVAKAVIDMLFPHGANGRIPIMAITGTNGKTTTTRLLAHVAKCAGYNVGYTTTDGIYIHDQMIVKGDCTGPVSTKTVLRDAGVDMAVLECARGGILRAGLGFDHCDVGIVTNVAEDHLGLQGIDSLEKLARVKSVIAESVCRGGYAILNADDDWVYNMKDNVVANVALFAMSPHNPRIIRHVENGGLAAVYENGYLTLLHENMVYRIAAAVDIPLTFSGMATYNIANILPVCLAAYVQHIHPQQITEALKSFIAGPDMLPGRMNIFDFTSFKIIVDYAHNAPGLRAITPFIQSLNASVKTGIITGVGDRRNEDIVALGAEAATIFDELVIRHDKDLRGRSAEEIDRLIYKGIRQVAPDKKVTIIPDELKAVKMALKQAVPNSVTMVFAEDIKSVINFLQKAHIEKHIPEIA
jgi:cyanophycin synthetase